MVRVVDALEPLTLPRQASWTIGTLGVRRRGSWTQEWSLTLDVGWTPVEVVGDIVQLLQGYGVASSWMAAHDIPMRNVLRDTPIVVLRIYRNFKEPVRSQDSRGLPNAKSVIENLGLDVPETAAVDGHSVAESSRILHLSVACALSHDVNTFMPSGSGKACTCWRYWSDMTQENICALLWPIVGLVEGLRRIAPGRGKVELIDFEIAQDQDDKRFYSIRQTLL